MTLRKKLFENNERKGENAGNRHSLLLLQHFLHFQREILCLSHYNHFIYKCFWICSSPKICCLGKKLNDFYVLFEVVNGIITMV